MQIYIVEKEKHCDDYWLNCGIVPCISLEVAIGEMNRLIEESNEGEFKYSKDRFTATSKNNWVRFRLYTLNVKE